MITVRMSFCALFLVLGVAFIACSGGETTFDVLEDTGGIDVQPTELSYDSADGNVERDVPPADVMPDEGEWVDVPPQPGEFGYPCLDGTQCNSSFCVDTPKGSVCTALCVQNCPQDWICKTTSLVGEPVSVCVPLFLNLCDPCEETSD